MDFLSTTEVSALIGVPPETLRYWRHADQGPASFRLGKRVLYSRDKLMRWIAAQEKATTRGGVAS
jgi:DNA-binding transcriptional MerR regulator